MRRLWICLWCCLCLGIGVQGSELVDPQDLQRGLDDQTQGLLQGIDPGDPDLSAGIRQIITGSWEAGRGYLGTALAVAGQLIAVCILCSLVGSLDHSKLPRIVAMAGVLAVGAVGIGSLRELSGADTVERLREYCDTLLPALAMATASSGGIATASALHLGTMLFVDLLVRLVEGLLQPLVYVYLGLACAGAALTDWTVCGIWWGGRSPPA